MNIFDLVTIKEFCKAMKSIIISSFIVFLVNYTVGVEIDINQYVDLGSGSQSPLREKFKANFDEENPEDCGTKLSSKEIYANLKESLASVRKSCGQLCDASVTGSPGKYFDQLTKAVDCKALFENENVDNASQFSAPPMRIPKWLYSDYNYDGRVEIEYFYRDDSKGSTHYTNWTKEMTELIQKQIDDGTLVGKQVHDDLLS